MGFMEIVLPLVVSFVITAAAGRLLIPALRRLKAGQSIKEIGPTWHMTKQGLSGGSGRQKTRSAGFHFHLHEPETAPCCGNATEIHFRPSFLKSEAM